MGVMAAELSQSGNIGVVGPVETGDAKLYVDGFIAGAASAGGNATATYTGSFSDVALASETAQAFASAGAVRSRCRTAGDCSRDPPWTMDTN